MNKAKKLTIREFRARVGHYIAKMDKEGSVYTLQGVNIGRVHITQDKQEKAIKACTPSKELICHTCNKPTPKVFTKGKLELCLDCFRQAMGFESLR